MRTFKEDLRYAIRGLRRHPGFTAAVVLTLALGIGANTAIFSVVRGVLLRGLPYPNAERVVALWESNPQRGWLRFGVSLHNLEDWQRQARMLEAIGAWWTGQANLLAGDRPERVTYALVSPEVFTILGTPAARGRTFASEENLPGNDAVAVVSHAFWQTALGGRPDVVGETVELDGRPLEIVGVMPADFAFLGPEVRLWKPFGMRPDDAGTRGAHWVGAIGLLAPTRTLDDARSEMDAVAARLRTAYPESNEGWTVFVESLRSSLVTDVRTALLVVWAAVGLVLLMACANVANLLLARATRREREIAVRSAIGAGRGRLLRQLLTESLTLAFAGGALGLALCGGVVTLVRALAPADLPRAAEVGVDGVVLAYAAGLVILTGLLFGALPAWRATESGIGRGLGESGRPLAGTRHRRARSAMVAAELALGVVVLVGAGLTVRSFARLLREDPGFDTRNGLTLRVAPSLAAYPEREAAAAFYNRLLERVRALPGVAMAGAVNVLPVSGSWWNTSMFPEGREYGPDEEPSVVARVVSGDYFIAMAIPLLRGRAFTDADDDRAEPVAVIDATTARRYWPDENPLGRRFRFSDDPRAFWYRIIGVVGEVRDNALDAEPTPAVYTTFRQSQFGHFRDWGMSLVIRTAGDAAALAEPARRAVAEVDPSLPVYEMRTLEQLVAEDAAARRYLMLLLGAFAGVALLLAAVGVYGVLSCTVAEQTREIGLRMALGADRSRVLLWVTGRGLGPAFAGMLLGLLTTLAATQWLAALLYQTGPRDPMTLSAVMLLLAVVACAACLIPARRATRIDPMEALREG